MVMTSYNDNKIGWSWFQDPNSFLWSLFATSPRSFHPQPSTARSLACFPGWVTQTPIPWEVCTSSQDCVCWNGLVNPLNSKCVCLRPWNVAITLFSHSKYSQLVIPEMTVIYFFAWWCINRKSKVWSGGSYTFGLIKHILNYLDELSTTTVTTYHHHSKNQPSNRAWEIKIPTVR